MKFIKSKTVILFDDCTNEASRIFNDNWEKENDIVALTATEENIVSLEKNNSSSNLVYIGDQDNIQDRIEMNKGICFNMTEFVEGSKRMASVSLSSSFDIRNINTPNIKNPRRVAHKIKKLNRWGIYHKILNNVFQ